jgi:Uma2 family endonuclease
LAEKIATPGAKHLTVDDFLSACAHLDDGNTYELQNGKVIVSPQPGWQHGELHFCLCWLLGNYEEGTLGVRSFDASGVQLAPDTLRGPDLTVVKDSDAVRFDKSKIVGVPSLVIEIVSPSKPSLDLLLKSGLYRSKGIPEIWFLDVEKKEALFLLKTKKDYAEQRLADGVFESKALKGFKLDVAALFALDKKRLRKVLEAK